MSRYLWVPFVWLPTASLWIVLTRAGTPGFIACWIVLPCDLWVAEPMAWSVYPEIPLPGLRFY